MHGDMDRYYYDSNNPVSKLHQKYWLKTYRAISVEGDKIEYVEDENPEVWGFTKKQFVTWIS